MTIARVGLAPRFVPPCFFFLFSLYFPFFSLSFPFFSIYFPFFSLLFLSFPFFSPQASGRPVRSRTSTSSGTRYPYGNFDINLTCSVMWLCCRFSRVSQLKPIAKIALGVGGGQLLWLFFSLATPEIFYSGFTPRLKATWREWGIEKDVKCNRSASSLAARLGTVAGTKHA